MNLNRIYNSLTRLSANNIYKFDKLWQKLLIDAKKTVKKSYNKILKRSYILAREDKDE